VVLYRAGRVQFHARHYNEAANLFRRILALKPDDQMGLYGVGIVCEAQKEFDRAIASFRDPYQMSRFDLIAAYAASGQKEEARKRLTAEMLRLQAGNSYVRPGYVAEVYSALGDKNQALYWLEKGYREHDAWLALLKVWPRLDPLRSDPRFQDLLRRMNFPTGL
jgi:tetratricopeptide (TPR) repeat protein